MLKFLTGKIDIIGLGIPIMIFIIGLISLNNAPYLDLDLNITNNKIYLVNYNNAELVSIGEMDVRPTDFTNDQDLIVSQDDFFHFIKFQYYISEYIQKDKDVVLHTLEKNVYQIISIKASSYPMILIKKQLILFLAALFCLIMPIILMRKKREDIRITLFILLLYTSSSVFLSFAFWSLREISLDQFSTLFILGMNYISFTYFPMFFLHFLLIFPKKRHYFIQRKFIYIFYSFPLFISILYLPRFVYEAQQILFLIAICGGIGMMVHSFFTSSVVEKAQIKWVLWGTIMFSIIMMVTYILPLMGYMSELYSYQIPAVAFALLPISMTFAIEKYRLMDIDSLIDNTLIYTATFILLIMLDFAVLITLNRFVSDHLSDTSSTFLILWIAIAFYFPLRQFVTMVVQKLLKRGRYHSHEIALNLAKLIIPIEKIDKIVEVGMETIDKTLHPVTMEVHLFKDDEKLMKDSVIDFSSLIRLHLSEPEYVFNLPAQIHLPKIYSSGIIAPIVNGDGVLGFILLGEKQSQQLYGRKDIELVEMVSTQMAIGIDGVRVKELAKKDKEKMIREIHDGIGGIATNISLIAQMAKESPDFTYVTQSISTISELSNDAVFEIRSILQSLDISTSTSKELIDTLRRYAITMLEPHGVEFELNENIRNIDYVPSAVVTLNIFRIYREALTNIVKYANATRVESLIVITPENFILMIKDNGIGFQGEGGGRGMGHMYQRAKEIGGRLSVSEEEGVKIEIHIPLMGNKGNG